MASKAHTPMLLIGVLLGAVLVSGCGFDQEHDKAVELFERVRNDTTLWMSPGEFAQPQKSSTAHRSEVRVLFNDTMAAVHVDLDDCSLPQFLGPAMANPDQRFDIRYTDATQWPDGSIIYKEGYSGDEIGLIAIMEKVDGEWFFAEYDGEGNVLFSGTPDTCTSCHAGARHDYVFTGHLSFRCPPPSEL